ncbi:hypothetical protein C0995_005223, partial [Termitomyces sp. Mi166
MDLTAKLEDMECLVKKKSKEICQGKFVQRKLLNMVLNLKENIHVFCCICSVLASDSDEVANIMFLDKQENKEIVLKSF